MTHPLFASQVLAKSLYTHRHMLSYDFECDMGDDHEKK